MISILVINKQSVFIRTLEPFLATRGIVIEGICQQPTKAFEYYRKLKTGIVLIDTNLIWDIYTNPVRGLIGQLKEFNPMVKVIAVANFKKEGEDIKRLKTYGVNGFFYRSIEGVLDEIVTCIKKVDAGEESFAM